MDQTSFANYTLSRGGIGTKLFSYSCILVVFLLPYSIKLTSYSLIFLVIAWLIQGDLRFKISKLIAFDWLFVGTPLLYLIYVFSFLYSDNLNTALRELEKGIGLLILPLIFTSSRKLSREETNRILWSFIISNLSLGLICISYATFQYLNNHINIFYNHELVGLFKSHATYYSMYLIFCLMSLAHLNNNNEIPWQPKIIIGGISIFFIILIYLLGARSLVFLFSFASIIIILIHTIRSKNIGRGIILGISFLLLVFVVIRNNPDLQERIFQLKNYKYEFSENHTEGYNGLTMRLAQWESSISIIVNDPILGVGIGDVQDELQKVYKKNYLKYSYIEQFNAHNEYIQTLLGLGLVGLVIFLASLMIPGYQAFREREILYLGFLGLFAYCCITESMLHMQKGVVFYTFFNSLFYFHSLGTGKQTSKGT
jgi:O-antigen ligase